MGVHCREGTWLYPVVNTCVPCDKNCYMPNQNARCTEHCASRKCTARRGHYYDLGLKQCINCTSLCGSPPEKCRQHCLPDSPSTATPLLATPRTNTTTALEAGRLPSVLLPVSVPLLYSLLGLCVIMLVCILGLSLLVFLRTARKRPARLVNPGPTVTTQEEGGVQRAGRGDDGQGDGHGRNYKQPLSACRSNPTESCECTHCFPDLRVPCRGGEVAGRLIYSLHQQASSSSSSPQHSGTRWGQEEQGHGGGPRRVGGVPSL